MKGSCYKKYLVRREVFFYFENKTKYNKDMESDYNLAHWTKPCPSVKCKKNIDGLIYVLIPASMGDDSAGSPVAPKNGAYSNAIVEYEANGKIYIYSAEGVPVEIPSDVKELARQLESLTVVVDGKVSKSDLVAMIFTEEGWSDLWL